MSSKKNAHKAGEAAPTPDNVPAPETAAADAAAAPETAQAPAAEKQPPEKTPEQKLAEELAAEKDKSLRLAAEYDNFRRRSARERESFYADVKADTVLRLLPVYDNLERALSQETADAAFRKGVEMTLAQFHEVLEKLGVTPIAAVGQTFDPALHNAVMHVEDAEKGENEIVAEFQKGFKMGDRVIRFSMVQVAN